MPGEALWTRNNGGAIHLAFDPDQLIDNLLLERYPNSPPSMPMKAMLRSAYYMVRPFLSVSARAYLQRLSLAGWRKTPFPAWPVDYTVEQIFEKLLLLALRTQGRDSIPFIWFWPDGHQSCAIVTHDVETTVGMDFCSRLMDLDDSCGFKASFQVIPEKRYEVPVAFLKEIRRRGFEVNVHDLNHDGNLFLSQQHFEQCAAAINRYGREFEAAGFRSGLMYRNQEWFRYLNFQYDMSVSNVSHLNAQHGGCCTVLPYFIGDLLELPLTTTQDYALFHLLQEYSLEHWKSQINTILQRHGLISVLIHPDYIMGSQKEEIYLRLLRYLADLRRDRNIWTTTPGEVNAWWRVRDGLSLIQEGSDWRIRGPKRERARIAYASIEGEDLVYRIEGKRCSKAASGSRKP